MIEDYFSDVPEYYPFMYKDGYSPYEVWHSFQRKSDQEDGIDIGQDIIDFIIDCAAATISATINETLDCIFQ